MFVIGKRGVGIHDSLTGLALCGLFAALLCMLSGCGTVGGATNQGKSEPVEKVADTTEGKEIAGEQTGHTAVSSETQDRDVVHFADYDLVVPDAWTGKVSLADNSSGEQWLEWDGWRLVMRLSDHADVDGLISDGKRLSSFSLANGLDGDVYEWNDGLVVAVLYDSSGNRVTIGTTVADQYLGDFWERSEQACDAYFQMQADAAGLPVTADPTDVAIALLRACAEGISITRPGEQGEQHVTETDGGVDVSRLPRRWSGDYRGTSDNGNGPESEWRDFQLEIDSVSADGTISGTCIIDGTPAYCARGRVDLDTWEVSIWGTEWIEQGHLVYMCRFDGTLSRDYGHMEGKKEALGGDPHPGPWELDAT